MGISKSDLTTNPDLFASEVHFCLFNDGVRSRALRQLWKLAKGNAELERILEIKVAEFRRALRECRTPTVWNLPLRIIEWVTEHYRFTPPREVLTTLAYVTFVLVAIDTIKSKVPWSRLGYEVFLFNSGSTSPPHRESDLDLLKFAAPQTRIESTSQVDDWLVSELKRAAESVDLQQVLAQRLTASLQGQPLDQLLESKIAEIVQSDSMREMLRQQMLLATEGLVLEMAKSANTGNLGELVARDVELKLKAIDLKPLIKTALPDSVRDPVVIETLTASLQKAVGSTELGQSLKTSVISATTSTESKAALQQATQAWIASDDFKKLMAGQLQKSVEATEFQQQLKASVTAASGSAESKAAIQQAVQAWFGSEDFKKLVAAAMLKAQEPAKLAVPVTVTATPTVDTAGTKP